MGGSREKKSGFQRRRYTPEFKLKAVQLHLQGGHPQSRICRELAVGKMTLCKWVHDYKLQGPAGLAARPSPLAGQPKLPAPITDQILAIKRQNPAFGITRIAQVLRRWFLLPASPSTVRQRLQEAHLMPPAPRKKRRSMTRPRFFERATPNQLWQSDIFTFRLGGRYAYLIAFLDDHSRYVVGADLFRSPTAEAVIEVYRVAVAEFKPPREMLTDNGRQYEHKHRRVIRRIVAPPAFPLVVRPRASDRPEHVAPEILCANVFQAAFGEVVVHPRGAIAVAVHFLEGACGEDPSVEIQAAHAKRIFEILVRPSPEAIE